MIRAREVRGGDNKFCRGLFEPFVFRTDETARIKVRTVSY
jgi:hypothetical protein